MRSVDDLLTDYRALHSDLQIEAWIVNRDNWTAFGRYQQTLRELHARRGALEKLTRDRELAELDLRDLERRRPWFGANRVRRWELKVEQQRQAIRELSSTLAECRRELDRFHELADSLKAEVGDLTEERRRELDRETWIERMRMMAAVDLAANGRIGPSLITMIAAAPRDIRRVLIDDTRTPQRLLSLLE